jgi:proteasome activator subunit 4
VSSYVLRPGSPLTELDRPTSDIYVDKIRTGFLSWTGSIKGYRTVGNVSLISWEPDSQAVLRTIKEIIQNDDYFDKLTLLWSQETNRSSKKVDLRTENLTFIKSLGYFAFSS